MHNNLFKRLSLSMVMSNIVPNLKVSFILAFLFINTYLIAQENAKGLVFHDKNNNGLFDNNEKGISGVVVSNGRDVVTTNKKGKYEINLSEGEILFISKPSGYKLSLNENHLPKFYYHHSPQGAPKLHYEGVKPTGELPKSINFPLTEIEQEENFTAYVAGDPQPKNKKQLDYYRDDILANMLHYDADMYIALGDIVDDDLSLYSNYNQMVGYLDVPVYNVYGNHDINFRAKGRKHAAETFMKHFGPTYYSFNYGKVHFVIMDNIDYKGWDETENKDNGYRGFFGEQQLIWLKKDLAFVPKDFLVVFSMHIPITSAVWKGERVSVADSLQFFDIVKSRENVLLLAGHMHIVEYLKFGEKNGWSGKGNFWQITAGAGCGAWWQGPADDRNIPIATGYDGVPNGFYLFNFKGNAFDFEYIPANKSEKFQMRIESPTGTVLRDSLPKTDIVVNVFNASKYTEVMADINGLKFMLDYKPMEDLFMKKYIENHRDHYAKKIYFPTHTHMFVGELPTKLPSGIHTIKIETNDPFGHKYTGYRFFELK